MQTNKGLKLDGLIVSCGGVGTTFLIEWLNQYIKVNCPYDTDGLKHAPKPSFRDKDLKILYVTGSPSLAVQSLFRRGFAKTQSKKLVNQSVKQTYVLKDLDDYIKRNQDVFRFEQHFVNWTQKYCVNRTLIVNYDNICESTLYEIARFFGITDDLDLPRLKARSNYDIVRTRELDIMYRDFRTIVEKITRPKLLEPEGPKLLFRYCRLYLTLLFE